MPHLSLGINDQIKAPALAGGIIQSGDFLISLSLICDSSLISDDMDFPEYSWQGYSEVRYLGLASGWEYIGTDPEHEDLGIRETLMINGEIINWRNTGSQQLVTWGSGQLHYSPLNTENQIVARTLILGEPLIIELTISNSKTSSTMRMEATFEETSDGFHLVSAEIMAE